MAVKATIHGDHSPGSVKLSDIYYHDSLQHSLPWRSYPRHAY